jgi:hypothetical protein
MRVADVEIGAEYLARRGREWAHVRVARVILGKILPASAARPDGPYVIEHAGGEWLCLVEALSTAFPAVVGGAERMIVRDGRNGTLALTPRRLTCSWREFLVREAERTSGQEAWAAEQHRLNTHYAALKERLAAQGIKVSGTGPYPGSPTFWTNLRLTLDRLEEIVALLEAAHSAEPSPTPCRSGTPVPSTG